MQLNQRYILFILGCVPARILLVLLLYYYPTPFLAFLTGFISLSFLYQFYKHKKTGFFGGEVYWHKMRIFHFTTYFIASIFLLLPEYREYAYILLIADLVNSLILVNLHYR